MKKFLLLLLIILSGTSSELLACEDVMFSIDFNAEAVIPEVISYNLYDNAGQHEGLITIAGESNFPFSICIEGECFVLEFASESGMDGVEDIFINDGQSEFSFFFYETEEGVGMEGCLEALPTCPDAIFATSECLTGVFELGSFVDGATVEWTFSDGAYEQGGHFITHEFPEEGEYTVCAYYISPFCEGETYCETIYVEDCSDNCTPEIEIWEQVDCGAYHVGITNLEDVNMFDWYLNGELYWEDGNYMVVYLEENGVHNLCAVYESEECGQVEVCIDLVAEECEETCTDVQFGLLNLTSDITSVDWSLTGPGITFAEGTAEYDGFGTEWIDLCIEEGCYYFEVTSEEGLFSNNTFSLSKQGISGPVTLEGVVNTPFVLGFEFCVGPTLVYPAPCPSELWYNASCEVVEFEIGSFQEGEVGIWDFGDGTIVEGGHYITHDYQQPGEYYVCVEFSSNECEGTTECMWIYVPPCNECPTDIYVDVNPNCLATFILEGGSEDGQTFWVLEDELVNDGSPYFDQIIEEEGWHTICAEYIGPGCDGTYICTEFYVDACGQDECQAEIGIYLFEGCFAEIFLEGVDYETPVYWSIGDEYFNLESNYGFGYQFEETGWYNVCVEFWTEECGGQYICEEIYIEGCGASCEAEIIGSVNNCFGFFYVEGISDEVSIDWDINGDQLPNQINTGLGYDFEENGWQTICASFYTEECGFQEICTDIFVQGCDDSCNPSINFWTESCFGYFNIDGIPDNVSINWLVDGVDYQEMYNTGFYFDFTENGWHQVCASFFTEACGYQELCTEVFIDGCSTEECEAEIDIYLFDGCFAEISISGVDGDTPIYWSVGDEYFEYQANNGFGIDFPGEGVYEVCAEFWTEECGGIVLCEEVYVEGCDTDCFFVGAVDQLSCEEFVMNMTSNFPEGEPLIYVDDVFIGSGWSLYFYLEPGEHVVCANLEGNEFCEQQWFCQDVYVEDCDCPTWIEAEVQDCLAIFYLDVVEGDVSYTVYGEAYQETFDGQGGIFTWPAPQNGFYEVCAFYFSDECEGTSVCTGFEITGCSDGECEITLDYDWIEGTTYVFEAESNQEGAPIGWLINGEYIETGNAFDYTFNEPGVYEVCAIIETEECPLGVQSCVNLVVPPSNDCTEVIITIDVEGDLLGDLDIAYELDGLDFPFGGDFTIYETCGSTIISFCIPDGCYEMTMSLEEFIEVAILMEMFIDGGIAYEYTIDPLTQTVTMEFGVNDDCSTSISEVDAALIEVYPVPSSDQITVNHNLGNATWNIFDAQGRLIESGTTNGQQLMTIDIQSLATGTYVIQLLNNQNTLLQRFQKVD